VNAANDNFEQPGSTAHPLAGKSMTGADIIVQVLVDEGVDTIFG
jgi:acetolactate synthase-1/2/3 large subunit